MKNDPSKHVTSRASEGRSIAFFATLRDNLQWLLPRRVLQWMSSLRQPATREIDLAQVQILRQTPIPALEDPNFLETELLPRLGLNDEDLHEFPTLLYPFCGAGLRHWQYPNQFSHYLVFIKEHGIQSYLEIGVRHGGTFVITVEYLQRFGPLRKALGVDLVPCPSLSRYAESNSIVEFLQADSQRSDFRARAESLGPFDLVFLDGLHTFHACLKDFEDARETARLIVVHDITNDLCRGVGRAWLRIRRDFTDEFTFHEFVEQYEEVQERTGKRFFGIGVAVRKTSPSGALP